MCGRFTLRTPETLVATLFPEMQVPELRARYNIAPTQQLASIRHNKNNQIELAQLRWGLVPFWAPDLKIGARMINARSETVEQKPSFRNAFKQRRCLVLADGYYEWKKIDNRKQPFLMTTNDNGGGFCMAGLWESWTEKATDQQVQTCTILTTDASPSLMAIHDRMPVVVDPDDFEFWLDREFNDVEKLKSICKPARDDYFKARAVSTFVNNARHDSPQCVANVDPI